MVKAMILGGKIGCFEQRYFHPKCKPTDKPCMSACFSVGYVVLLYIPFLIKTQSL